MDDHMSRIKKIVAYTLYITGATLFFLYFLFPSNTVKSYIEYRLAEISPEINVHIERIHPRIPPGFSFSNAYILFKDEAAIRIDSVDFKPGYLSMFTSEPRVKFTAALAGGEAVGVINMNSGADNGLIKTRINFEGVDLQAIPLLRSMYPGNFSGMTRGSIDYEASLPLTGNFPGKGNAMVDMVNVTVTLENNIPGLDTFSFSRVSADTNLENHRIAINRLDMEGSQFSAECKGALVMAQPVESSRIDLNGTVQIHPELIRSAGPLLPRQYVRDGRVSLRITGTLDNPRFSLR